MFLTVLIWDAIHKSTSLYQTCMPDSEIDVKGFLKLSKEIITDLLMMRISSRLLLLLCFSHSNLESAKTHHNIIVANVLQFV